MTEIALGIPKSRSRVVKTQAGSILWDNLARGIGQAAEMGMVLDYGLGRDADE